MKRVFVILFVLLAVSLFAQTEGSRPDALQNYRIGRDLESRGRMDEANSYYNEAVRICTDELRRNSSNMDSYTVLTWAMLRQRRYSEVITWGQRAMQINSNDFRVIETMGEAYFYLNDYAASRRCMELYANALPTGDRSAVAFFFIGEIYRIENKFRLADIAYSLAVRLEPSSALWWYRLGTARESAGDFSQAAEAYERVLRLDPSHRQARDGLARSRRQTG